MYEPERSLTPARTDRVLSASLDLNNQLPQLKFCWDGNTGVCEEHQEAELLPAQHRYDKGVPEVVQGEAVVLVPHRAQSTRVSTFPASPFMASRSSLFPPTFNQLISIRLTHSIVHTEPRADGDSSLTTSIQ